MAEFDIYVSKEDFKFNCAHFIAYKGFRERLHGHNYRASVKVTGSAELSPDGYLIDFGDIKKAARAICKDLNEYFILPTLSDAMTITEEDSQICLTCEDGATFSMPKTDCAMLPIYHSSAEELAHYLYCAIVRKIGLQNLLLRGIKSMEISIAEVTNQMAIFRSPIPATEELMSELQRTPLRSRPSPCLSPEDA